MSAAPLDVMSLERWGKLREAEFYQLNIADGYYRKQQWKVALAEYEKFMTLYEKSEGAPYAQLRWGVCQVQLRKLNTAIKDGFQSVIDYWPESPEAVASAYFIGKTYKDMGETKPAKKAYAAVLAKNPKHLTAVLARVDLLDIARKENDTERTLALLKELTFDTERKGETVPPCVAAARELTWMSFTAGNFDDGLKALATCYKEDDLPAHLRQPQQGRLLQIVHDLTGQTEPQVKARGLKLADAAIAYLRGKIPADLKDESQKNRARQYWLLIAEIHGQARRPDNEREVYEQLLKTFGTDDVLLGHLAGWHKNNNRRDEARRIYQRFKDPVEGQNQLALSYREEKKIEPAVELYRKLSVQDLKNTPRWLLAAAATYREGGKPDQAMAVYRELIGVDVARAPDYHWEIANTLYQFHRWKEAIAAYRGTDRLPQSYERMAHCQRQLKQYDEALILYRQIVVSHPPSAPSALLEIGYTLEEAGKKEPAIKTFQQVCERYPKTGEASKAHVHLNNKYKITITLGGAKDE